MEDGLAKVPKLELAQYKFILSRVTSVAVNTTPNKAKLAKTTPTNIQALSIIFNNNNFSLTKIKDDLLAEIVKDNMTPFYLECCKDLNWQVDQALVNKMKQENENKLKELDSKIEDAEKNLGETEIRETNLAKAEYLSLIGDKVI